MSAEAQAQAQVQTQFQTETKNAGAHHAPLAKIKDIELLPLLRSGKVKLVTDVVKNKKKGKADLYGGEFRWTDTNEPLLTQNGVVDSTATVVWGVPPPEKRNTGEFGKPDGPFDECDLQFATKTSGTFGELMCELNDNTYPRSIREFTERADQKDLYAGHEIDPFQFCKKTAGSLKNPAPPAEQMAYTAAADWNFTVKLKLSKYVVEKDGSRKTVPNAPFMWKLVKYVLNPQGIPVEQEIKVNSQNIHKELTRGSKILIAMRPGNGTMKAATVKVGGKPTTVNTFFPAWNFSHITMLKKGEFTATKVERSPEEIRAALEAAGVTLSFEPSGGEQQADETDEEPDENQPSGHQPAPAVGVGSTQFKPGAVGATGSDLASQFANLNV
jgi:hypothetical protein